MIIINNDILNSPFNKLSLIINESNKNDEDTLLT